MCKLFDPERYQAMWTVLRCAEKFGDWKWFGDALLYYWMSSQRHVAFHIGCAWYGYWLRG